jgi:hypothetical protein
LASFLLNDYWGHVIPDDYVAALTPGDAVSFLYTQEKNQL